MTGRESNLGGVAGPAGLDRLRPLLENVHEPTCERAWTHTLGLLELFSRRFMTMGDRVSRGTVDVAGSVAGDLWQQSFDPRSMGETELRCYLAVAVRHKLVHYGRRRRARKRVPSGRLRAGPRADGPGDVLDGVAADTDDPLAAMINAEERASLAARVRAMDAESRRLVGLVLEGLPYAAIGPALGITAAAARKRMERLRGDLATRMLADREEADASGRDGPS